MNDTYEDSTKRKFQSLSVYRLKDHAKMQLRFTNDEKEQKRENFFSTTIETVQDHKF